jgi:hypothetical protein
MRAKNYAAHVVIKTENEFAPAVFLRAMRCVPAHQNRDDAKFAS